MQLSRDFHIDEFKCRCRSRGVDKTDAFCHGIAWPHPQLIKSLQTVREYFDEIIVLTSACRCPSYNKIIGGAPKSFHIRGMASDIVVSRYDAAEVYGAIKKMPGHFGFTGLIYYPLFNHVDTRGVYGYPAYFVRRLNAAASPD